MVKFIELVKSLFIKDSGDFQIARCSFFGKTQDLKALNIYGISFCAPENSFGIALSPNGYGDDAFVLLDRPDLRFKGLAPGEMKIGNYVTGSYVYFKADGTIEISATNVKVIGSLEVTGDITANDFKSSGIGVDFNPHVHSDPQGGLTGGPQ